MRSKSNHLAIVAFSFALSDLLATGPIDHIRWTALCRGKRRFSPVRRFGRRVQGTVGGLGLAFSTGLDWLRDRVQAGCGRVSDRVRGGYRLTREKTRTVQEAIERRVGRVSGRVTQVGQVVRMYARMYGMVATLSREAKGVGWTVVGTLPAPEPTPAVAYALPMVSAARTTTEEEPARDKDELLNRAKAMLAEGKSQRATAKALGVSGSTLRSWLKKSK